MIRILYLAAGQSRRYGSNKLLAELDGRPLYRHGLEVLRQAASLRDDCTLSVVTCWDEIRASLAAEPASGIRCVPCPDSHRGISYTIRAGIASVRPLNAEDYLLFAAADQPYLTKETIARLLDSVRHAPLTACLSCGNQSGNPVLFSAVLADELCALEGDRGGKSVMLRHPENHINIPCLPRELRDVDVRGGGSEG